MNADLFDESLKESLDPSGFISIDNTTLSMFIAMYSIAIENSDDIQFVAEEVENAKKLYYDYYEKEGKLDEFKKAFEEMEKTDKKIQMGNRHIERVKERESNPVAIVPLEATGDIEKDARRYTEESIKMMDSVMEYSDMMFMQQDSAIKFSAIEKRYSEDAPDHDEFWATSDRIAEELGIQKHMDDFETRSNEFMSVLTQI